VQKASRRLQAERIRRSHGDVLSTADQLEAQPDWRLSNLVSSTPVGGFESLAAGRSAPANCAAPVWSWQLATDCSLARMRTRRQGGFFIVAKVAPSCRGQRGGKACDEERFS